MAQPRQREPERRPAEISVPQLTQAVIRSRAEAGYDRAVTSILAPKITQLRNDSTALRNQILQDQRTLAPDASEDQRNQRLQDTVNAFTQRNPNSPLSQYLARGTDIIDFSYSFRGRQVSLTVNIDRAPVEASLRSPFDQLRTSTVNQLIAASAPTSSTQYNVQQFVTIEGMDPTMASQLGTALMRELGTPSGQAVARNHLPISVTYTTQLPPDLIRLRGLNAGPAQALAMSYTGPRVQGTIQGG